MCIRLGPPAGSMTVDHRTDSGLLCLGGGTGIAPIKALVEDVAEHGRPRPVEVFYGARTDHDLYDIDTMLRLSRPAPLARRSAPSSPTGAAQARYRRCGRASRRGTPIRPVARVRRLSLRAARNDPQPGSTHWSGSASRPTAYATIPSKNWPHRGPR